MIPQKDFCFPRHFSVINKDNLQYVKQLTDQLFVNSPNISCSFLIGSFLEGPSANRVTGSYLELLNLNSLNYSLFGYRAANRKSRFGVNVSYHLARTFIILAKLMPTKSSNWTRVNRNELTSYEQHFCFQIIGPISKVQPRRNILPSTTFLSTHLKLFF